MASYACIALLVTVGLIDTEEDYLTDRNWH